MNRRTAIKNSLLGVGALALGSCQGTKSAIKSSNMQASEKVGVQLFTVPNMVDNDFEGSLKLMSDIGYKELEFFGPYPFSAEPTIQQWEQFKPMLGLKNNAFYGHSVKETADLLKKYNLSAPSFHIDKLTLETKMSEVLDTIAPLGPKYLIIAALFEGRSNLDDYKKLADTFNSFGEQMAKYDMAFAYHNHGYEHNEMDGQIPMDFLIQNTNPDTVKFELDIFWMSAAGADPKAYLKKYPNRYKLMHIKDSREQFQFAGDGGTPDQWMAVMDKMEDPGDGVFDIDGIIALAEESGVEHFLLERDRAPQPEQTLKNSYAYLSKVGKR
ncbi:MAG: sugar phosphate isomerase/epimerase [Bacteroidota bacterium]